MFRKIFFKIVRCAANLRETKWTPARSFINAERGCGLLEQRSSVMKLFLSVLAVAAATVVFGAPARAQNYPWCAIYSGGAAGGGRNCGFVSFDQCMATARGLGSFCTVNSQYEPPPGPHPHRRYPYPY
jgi:hypothetical protein